MARFEVADGAFEADACGAPAFGGRLTEVDAHFFVVAAHHVEAAVLHVVDAVEDLELRFATNGLAVVGCRARRTVENGCAEFYQHGVGEGLEDNLVAYAVGVARREAYAEGT